MNKTRGSETGGVRGGRGGSERVVKKRGRRGK